MQAHVFTAVVLRCARVVRACALLKVVVVVAVALCSRQCRSRLIRGVCGSRGRVAIHSNERDGVLLWAWPRRDVTGDVAGAVGRIRVRQLPRLPGLPGEGPPTEVLDQSSFLRQRIYGSRRLRKRRDSSRRCPLSLVRSGSTTAMCPPTSQGGGCRILLLGRGSAETCQSRP